MDYGEILEELISCKEIIAIALGGSRSRGENTPNSDYDLFCVVCDKKFELFRREFASFLEKISCVKYAAEVFYLENWGYLFKAIDSDGIIYDISIISKARIQEMGIRSTNKIIKDTDNVYQHFVEQANDNDFLVSKLEKERLKDYGTLYGFERKRFSQAISKEDYWYAVRCLERMKNYLIRCVRIEKEDFSKSQSCPEKGYSDVNDCLKEIYIIDGKINTLVFTAEKLDKLFQKIIMNVDIRKRSQLHVES